MADTKLSALTELAATPAADDELYIRDVSELAADESKRVRKDRIARAFGTGWTAAKLLLGAGAGADPTEIDVPSGLPDAIAGDILEVSADLEKQSDGTDTYKKHKEIYIARAGAYRIKFDMKSSATHLSYAKVYKNGAAFGTEQNESSTSYVTKSEDLSGWAEGDLCQLYLHGNPTYGESTYAKNFRIYVDNPLLHYVITD